MRNIKKYTLLLPVVLLLTGCLGEKVVTNSGEVSKELGVNGLEPGIRQPGSYRMESCNFSACPVNIRLETAVSAQTITIKSVHLPKSNIALDDVQINLQFRIKRDKASINQAYADIRSEKVSAYERFISSEQIFTRYIVGKGPATVIKALRGYTIDEALSKPDVIAEYALTQVNLGLKDTPVEITELSFPNGVGTPPEVVVKSKNELYAIKEDKIKEIKALEAALEIEDQRQAVSRKRAVNDAEIAAKLNISVAQYQCLRTMDTFADAASNGTTIAFSGDCGLSSGGSSSNFIPFKQ